MSKFIDNLGFMAWDKRHEKLLKVAILNAKTGDVLYDLDNFFKTNITSMPQGAGKEDVILLPYTGHEDRNENPLFEGVIVKMNDDLYEVTYNDYNGFTVANIYNWFSVVYADKVCEIVGNVFEDVDLRKKVRGER